MKQQLQDLITRFSREHLHALEEMLERQVRSRLGHADLESLTDRLAIRRCVNTHSTVYYLDGYPIILETAPGGDLSGMKIVKLPESHNIAWKSHGCYGEYIDWQETAIQNIP